MQNKLTTPKEFYEYLNTNKDNKHKIGISMIYKLVRRKDFPALKIGGRYYIIENKIDDWLLKQSEKFWC